MSRITVIDTPLVTLWYHPDKKVVHHQSHGFLHGQDFRDVLTAGCSLLTQHGATKWLGDDRSSSVLAQEDLDWAKQNWVGRAMAIGWKHLANVRPLKALGKMGIERGVKDLLKMGLNVRFFEEPEEGMAWLEKQ